MANSNCCYWTVGGGGGTYCLLARTGCLIAFATLSVISFFQKFESLPHYQLLEPGKQVQPNSGCVCVCVSSCPSPGSVSCVCFAPPLFVLSEKNIEFFFLFFLFLLLHASSSPLLLLQVELLRRLDTCVTLLRRQRIEQKTGFFLYKTYFLSFCSFLGDH